jgi:hypothetical protein
VSPQHARDDAPDPTRKEQGGRRGRAVETAADVRQVLAEAIDNMRTNPDLDPLRKGRVLAQLASAALRAIEMGELEARVEAIETVLKRRKNRPT